MRLGCRDGKGCVIPKQVVPLLGGQLVPGYFDLHDGNGIATVLYLVTAGGDDERIAQCHKPVAFGFVLLVFAVGDCLECGKVVSKWDSFGGSGCHAVVFLSGFH
jgi:hypothetical protein